LDLGDDLVVHKSGADCRGAGIWAVKECHVERKESTMATEYDPKVLQTFADVLYDKAKSLVVVTALRYAAITFVVVWLLVAVGASVVKLGIEPSGATVAAVIAAIFGLLLGVDAGKIKGFELRLQAQQVLCQMQIELNTRNQGKRTAQATAVAELSTA
jgi:hypothetical protein